MKVVTAEEMRNIDMQTIQEVGIPGIVLMENAGLGVVCAIEERWGDKGTGGQGDRETRRQGDKGVRRLAASPFRSFSPSPRPLVPPSPHPSASVSILVGRGNNGGDGLVVARHLANRGYNVKTYIMAESDKFTGDALTNLQIVQNMRLPLEFILSEEQLEIYKEQIAASDLLVDAIFGTGLKGAVRGFAADVINFLNRTGLPIVAIDLPSGLEASTGKVEGPCIRAAVTVTMALPKRGLLLYPGADFVGQLHVVDIGVPHGGTGIPACDIVDIVESQSILVNLLEASEAARLLPNRPRDAHKGTFGRVLVLAGSVGFTGAAAMTGEAALRVGAGLVTLGIPRSLNAIMEVKLTEVMTRPLPETESLTLASEARDEIMGLLNDADVVALGPGLSRVTETVSLVQNLCKEVRIPKVIDADGLNALAEDREILKDLGPKTILTPHPGEMARLMGCSVAHVQSDRIGVAQSFAEENGVMLVLKGAPTVIADPQGIVYLNTTGNPGLASGGTGDVLTGAIAGFLAQGLEVMDAAILGVYIHGLAGDLVAMTQGEAGMIAGDVLHQLPSAIQQLNDMT